LINDDALDYLPNGTSGQVEKKMIFLFKDDALQQQGAILRSTYHRKQQRKKFPKTRICEP
jgi:hypothetical protein